MLLGTNSSEPSSGCPSLLSTDFIEDPAVAVTAVCCLELSLQFTSLFVRLVLPILHDLNFHFRPVPRGGSARNFDRRLSIRRQTLQASVPVLETVRTNALRTFVSLRLTAIHLAPSSRTFLFSGA